MGFSLRQLQMHFHDGASSILLAFFAISIMQNTGYERRTITNNVYAMTTSTAKEQLTMWLLCSQMDDHRVIQNEKKQTSRSMNNSIVHFVAVRCRHKTKTKTKHDSSSAACSAHAARMSQAK